ncbi:hypothetical protein AWB74_06327 [Caballeronia arvi]|uniref:Uncharacterized protein n=1 Tax=Caballeronia arvi TaxID=1777135 RepID=A0A158KNB4_9BURK|nr:hypothetical protein [Caballeronia arvi]SAL82617.1 hypothetical protein AWB74_06327 [Caballeronia arvi]
MDDSHEIKNTKHSRKVELTSRLFELLEILLTDAAIDVEVVARELGLKDEMRERLRRALDRLWCARGVVEAMREGQGPDEAEGRNDRERPNDGADPRLTMLERVRSELELLAEGWPLGYPDGAVEWRILDNLEGSPPSELRNPSPEALKSPPHE